MNAKLFENNLLELMATNQGESGISQVQLVIVGMW